MTRSFGDYPHKAAVRAGKGPARNPIRPYAAAENRRIRAIRRRCQGATANSVRVLPMSVSD